MADHTLSLDKLPAGSRIMEAEDFMEGHIDALPDEILRKKSENVVYDHPWPYNVQLDTQKHQPQIHYYDMEKRFFVPREDGLVLTNTVLETDKLEARPPVEPTGEHMDHVQRLYDWALEKDSVLIKLPRKRIWPKMNIKPHATRGIAKERKEFNVLNMMFDYSQGLITKHYNEMKDQQRVGDILGRRTVSFPHCHAPFERENRVLSLELTIDSMSIGKSPLPLIDTNPRETCNMEPLDISPRSWRSILEQTRFYQPVYSFTLPRNAHLHTILLASRIKRDYRDPDEMLARSLVHAFALSSQVARLRAYEQSAEIKRTDNSNGVASCILEDPLAVRQVNDKDLLDQPIVVQTIGYEHPNENFYFTRYQLNSLKFDDKNPRRVKNQAWHSGPISDLTQALRYYLDFHSFDETIAKLMTPQTTTKVDQQQEQSASS